jgi:lambda repressor-like predicted transcriptional regulator
MKTVYSAANISLVSIFQSVLEEHGIRCWIKNEYLSAGAGEIPPIECWPQICVDDDVYPEAQKIVDEALAVKVRAPWKCDPCGEEIEGQFTECWKCGKSRPPEG